MDNEHIMEWFKAFEMDTDEVVMDSRCWYSQNMPHSRLVRKINFMSLLNGYDVKLGDILPSCYLS